MLTRRPETLGHRRSPRLEAVADAIIEGSGPAAVAGYLRRLVSQNRLSPDLAGRRRLLLGHSFDKVRHSRQLFDGRDPAPFRERDLDEDAVEYLLAAAQEIPRNQPLKIVVTGPEARGTAALQPLNGHVQQFVRVSRLKRP